MYYTTHTGLVRDLCRVAVNRKALRHTANVNSCIYDAVDPVLKRMSVLDHPFVLEVSTDYNVIHFRYLSAK